jgi:hypothetical protein
MKIGAAFPSKYIKAADLSGKAHTLVVSRVQIEDVGGQGNEEDKPVLYFVGRTKGCVLNRTNAMAIAARYGEDTDEWTNQEVIVYPDTTMFQGKMVDCIRMRIPVPAATEAESDDIPF